MLNLVFTSLGLSGADVGLRDHPIATAFGATYLDGTSWTASAPIAPPAPAGPCTFKANTDYNNGVMGPSAAAKDQQDCCDQARAGSYAGGVLANGVCWFKTAADITKPSTKQGAMGCILPSAPVPPSGGNKLVIGATVPGDLLTDLQMAGQIGDPLYELNFLNSSIWDRNVWTYETSFGVDAKTLSGGASTLIVFDGIKMGAQISVNGKLIGNATDQYKRYIFPISAGAGELGEAQGENPLGLLATGNKLSVSFDSKMPIDGRFMACTGGWDWAPYTTTHTTGTGAHTFSKGLWKSVYTVSVDAGAAAITHVTPHTKFLGDYPTKPMANGAHGGFSVNVTAHLWAPVGGATGSLAASGSWAAASDAVAKTPNGAIPAGESTMSLTIAAPADKIKLWWPAGVGLAVQPLYNVTAMWTISSSLKKSGTTASSSDSAVVGTTRRIGFRVFALVTGNDTAPGYAKANKDADGSDTHGMMFRVNGAAMYSRGANMIPMEELEGRMDSVAHKILVKSSVDAGMNTLRVWGGGMFLPHAWYDACDEYGVLVYHDMQYAQNGHSPMKTVTQDQEFRHQIRRLSHHPAIAMWDGCNECHVVIGTNTGIYATFVMTVVAEEDPSRAVWPSCPAPGWTAGVSRLYGNPNGSPLGLQPRFLAARAIDVPVGSTGGTHETHGPYQHGAGFPAVNGKSTMNHPDFSSNIPISITQAAVGIDQDNVYASEFGCSVMSSFESMSPTLAKNHWGVHGGAAPDECHGGFSSTCSGTNVMAQRNYPCDNIIRVFFGTAGTTANLNMTGEKAFKGQLFQCMVGQALVLKQNIETRRAENQFGCLVWQLNEIWPTGGWGSVEYGTVGFTQGQVRGGRWKPLHYWYRASIYADVMATCGQNGVCYVRNDRASAPFNGTVTMVQISLKSGENKTHVEHVTLGDGPGAMHWFTFPSTFSADATTAVVSATVVEAGETLSSHMVQVRA